MPDPIPVYLFHDVLCAYCWVADQRIRLLQEELGDAIQVHLRPYPLRSSESPPDASELRKIARHVRHAAREPEGSGVTPMMWRSEDPPRSSLPPLIAAEAALAQGPEAQRALVERLRVAAFRGGINATRRDVILEAAATAGLEMRRFSQSFDSARTAKAVEVAHREAISRGVRAVPAVAIGDQWLMTGVRGLDEYRDATRRWLERVRAGAPVLTLH